MAREQTQQTFGGIPGVDAESVTPEPEDAEEGRGRKADVELLTMGRIIRLLEELDETARCRVMSYLSARYKEQP